MFSVRSEKRIIRTDVSQEDQERQQNHDEVAVPNDEAAVELKQTKVRHNPATDMSTREHSR